jgi:hypothetical protein
MTYDTRLLAAFLRRHCPDGVPLLRAKIRELGGTHALNIPSENIPAFCRWLEAA